MLSNVDQSHDRLVFFLIRNCKKIASLGKVVLNQRLQYTYLTQNGITASLFRFSDDWFVLLSSSFP